MECQDTVLIQRVGNLAFDNDGIKSVPDADDTVSTGSVTINGGTFNITADGDGISAEDTLKITGGTFKIYTGDDGVHADTQLDLGISGGLARDPEFYIYSSTINNLVIKG